MGNNHRRCDLPVVATANSSLDHDIKPPFAPLVRCIFYLRIMNHEQLYGSSNKLLCTISEDLTSYPVLCL